MIAYQTPGVRKLAKKINFLPSYIQIPNQLAIEVLLGNIVSEGNYHIMKGIPNKDTV
jgi:hypothetical protein